MIPHPPEIDRAYGNQVWSPYSRVTPIVAGVAGAPVTPISGDITHDWGSWPRTTLRADFPTAVTPAATTVPLSPYGDRLAVDVGIVIGGKAFTFRAATLAVHTVDIDRPSNVVSVEAVSFEALVNEDRYTTRDATPAGTSSAVVTGIVRRTLGAGHPVTFTATSNPALAVGAFPLDGDVWPTVEAIADAAGWDVFFDQNGALIIRDTPRKVGAPAVALTTGVGGTLTGYKSRRRWAFNGVGVVYEERTGTPPGRVVGTWSDTNPSSPTVVTGPYGRHTRRDLVGVDTGKLPTVAAANAAALTVSKRAADGFRSLELRAIPCPWVLPGDTARCVLLGGTTEDHLVAAVSWPLGMLDVATLRTTDDTIATAVGLVAVPTSGDGHPAHPPHPPHP